MTDVLDRPWLLVPGTLCTPAVFEPMLNELGVARSQCTSIDLDQPTIEAYRERLPSLVKPGGIVCGFSLGAIVTAHCADLLAHAHAIVMFGINPYPDPPERSGPRLSMRDQVAKLGAETFFRQTPPPVFAGDVNATQETITAMAVESQDHLPAQTEVAMGRPGALPALSQCTSTAITLAGTNDNMTPLSEATAAADAAPQGRAIALEGLGHYALLENPAACASAVRQALTELNATA